METRGDCSGGGAGLEEEAAQREREWEEAAEAVAYDSCTWPPPVVAVCGPGNCGKSAFSRLLLNTLIARYKKVGCLDIDVGQPEFTPPGFVSLHVLEQQANGTGLHVLTKMLKYVSPTHVIRVSTTVERKNLPSGTFWMNQSDEGPPVNLVEIRAAQNSPRHLLVKKEAGIIRDLRMVSDTDEHRFLNGTIVGLATSVSYLSVESSNPCCIGLGFIKAVDVSEGCIHLITPVSQELMEKVDIIFQSYIAVPSCLLKVIVNTVLLQLFRKYFERIVNKFPGCSRCV
nr:unnamed protein product [Digitaria exilis]